MELRVLLVCLLINCLAGEKVQQQTPSNSSDCCQGISEVIADLTKVVNKLTNICSATARMPRDCSDVAKAKNRTSGVYDIYIPNSPNGTRQAYCDFSNPKESWLVFQRRKDGVELFNRTWKEYADGFGQLQKDFWWGNDNLYALTNAFKYKLRIDLEDWNGTKRYAEYSTFKIASSAENYRLTADGYDEDSNAGDGLLGNNGAPFSTEDKDHDVDGENNCAQFNHGAWWYRFCDSSDLNAIYVRAEDFLWITFRKYPLKFAEMKIARL